MSSFVLLFLLTSVCQGNVLPDPANPNCSCINPFSDTIHAHLGDKNLTCEHNNHCYVDCDSTCGDVEHATGFTAKKGRCVSRLACSPVETPTIPSAVAADDPTKLVDTPDKNSKSTADEAESVELPATPSVPTTEKPQVTNDPAIDVSTDEAKLVEVPADQEMTDTAELDVGVIQASNDAAKFVDDATTQATLAVEPIDVPAVEVPSDAAEIVVAAIENAIDVAKLVEVLPNGEDADAAKLVDVSAQSTTGVASSSETLSEATHDTSSVAPANASSEALLTVASSEAPTDASSYEDPTSASSEATTASSDEHIKKSGASELASTDAVELNDAVPAADAVKLLEVPAIKATTNGAEPVDETSSEAITEVANVVELSTAASTNETDDAKPSCSCINPFADTVQAHLGDKNLTCEHNNLCYVDCDGACGDVQPAKGFFAKEGRCISKLACQTG